MNQGHVFPLAMSRTVGQNKITEFGGKKGENQAARRGAHSVAVRG